MKTKKKADLFFKNFSRKGPHVHGEVLAVVVGQRGRQRRREGRLDPGQGLQATAVAQVTQVAQIAQITQTAQVPQGADVLQGAQAGLNRYATAAAAAAAAVRHRHWTIACFFKKL